MKQILFVTLLSAALTASLAFAQMGGHMGSGQQGHMGGGEQHMEKMMQIHDAQGGLMHNMGQMSRLIQQLREMISENPDAETMDRMSALMEDMSDHLLKMSRMLKKGTVTQEEMQDLDEHNKMMQKSYDNMRW